MSMVINSHPVCCSLKCLASLLHYIFKKLHLKQTNKPPNKGCTQTSKSGLKSMAWSTSSVQFLDGIHASFSSTFCFPAAFNEHFQDLTISFPKENNFKIRQCYSQTHVHTKTNSPTGWPSFLRRKCHTTFLIILLFLK